MKFKEKLLIKAMEIVYLRMPNRTTSIEVAEHAHDLVKQMLKQK